MSVLCFRVYFIFNYVVFFCGWIPDLVIGVYAGAIGEKRATFGSSFGTAGGSA